MPTLKDKVALVTGAGGEHGLGRAIARRFAQEGAHVVVGDLTIMSTEAFRDLMIERFAQRNPLGRIGQPEDVANVAAFLASANGDYMTGQAISVSGGAVMTR